MKRISKKLVSVFLLCVMMVTGIFSTGVTEAAAGSTLVWPVPGHKTLSQGYHDGKAIDISDGSIAGAAVVAAMGGTVTNIWKCGSQHYGSSHNCNGFGTGLVIRGNDGRYYQYAHMMANSIPSNVYYGASVSAGQKIGAVGTTGNSSGYHLHFGISLGNYWNQSGINPANESYRDSASVQLSYSNVHVTFTDSSNAGLYGDISNPGRVAVTGVGAYVWNASGSLVVNHWENCGLSTSVIHQQLNIVAEAKPSGLAPGRYTYQLFAVANGTTFKSGTGSFQISHANHTWNSGKVTKKATTSSAGVRTYTCTVCGAKKTVTIPKVPTRVTLRSGTNVKGKKVLLRWSRVSSVSGYQVQYSTNKNFKSGVKNGYATSSMTAGYVINLTKNKTYYFRIRAYRTQNGITSYSAWSTRTIKVKVKK